MPRLVLRVGTLGGSGNLDGMGAEARFDVPSGIAIDNAGNIFVSDSDAIRKVTPTGVVTLFAGEMDVAGSDDGPHGHFNDPHGLTVDPAGNLIVADQNNHSIRKVTPEGFPVGPNGDVFVGDDTLVRRITSDGTVTTVAGVPKQRGVRPGPLPTPLNRVNGVAAAPNGNLVLLSEDAVLDLVLHD